MFDDVTVNVLYNVVNTIVTEHILSVEMWVAYGGSTETEVIDIVENIFEHNDVVDSSTDDMYFEPEFNEPDMNMSYETVEMEMEFDLDIEMPEMEMADIEMEMAEIEVDIEPEMEQPVIAETEEVANETTDETEEPVEKPKENVAEKPEPKESSPETTEDETKEEVVEEKQEEPKKEKAAKKIVKKMGDKGRYDSTNQLKTLIVMQVLGDTKTFFDSQKQLNDRQGFFTDYMIPDTQIENNNIAQYYLFMGSDGLINDMIDSQWRMDSE